MSESHLSRAGHRSAADGRQPSPRRKAHPLGPLLRYRRSAGGRGPRLAAAGVLFLLLAPLVVAAFLRPDERGFGTHRQLGHPPCSMMVLTGYPCPTCGMTTAFAYAVRGRWGAAFVAQPMGLLVAVALMAGACLALYSVVVPGRWQVNWYRVSPARVVMAVLVLWLAAWGFKIMVVRAAMGE